MDWVKIKTGHIYGTKLTLLQIGALITIQVMTAHFERIPTKSERRAVISDKLWTSLGQALQDQSTTIAEVLQEVCNDIARVMETQRKSRAKIEKFRNKAKNNTTVTVTATEQEDKEDKEERKIEGCNRFTLPELEIKTEHNVGDEPWREAIKEAKKILESKNELKNIPLDSDNTSNVE